MIQIIDHSKHKFLSCGLYLTGRFILSIKNKVKRLYTNYPILSNSPKITVPPQHNPSHMRSGIFESVLYSELFNLPLCDLKYATMILSFLSLPTVINITVNRKRDL